MDNVRDCVRTIEYKTVTFCGKPLLFCAFELHNGEVLVGHPSRDDGDRKEAFTSTFNLLNRERSRLSCNAVEVNHATD